LYLKFNITYEIHQKSNLIWFKCLYFQEDYIPEDDLPPRKYCKVELPATARILDRMDVGAECGAKILSSFCKDLEIMADEGHRMVVTSKKLRGQTRKQGTEQYNLLKDLEVHGET
jgi:hypothetical protein